MCQQYLTLESLSSWVDSVSFVPVGESSKRRACIFCQATDRKIKFTLPGPMTLIDTLADGHYGDRVKMAYAFAKLLNEEARGLLADIAKTGT